MELCEVINAVTKNEKCAEGILWGRVGEKFDTYIGEFELVNPSHCIGEITHGATYQTIFRHVESGELFAMDITYDSWDSPDYNHEEIYKVTPKEKTYIVYERAE